MNNIDFYDIHVGDALVVDGKPYKYLFVTSTSLGGSQLYEIGVTYIVERYKPYIANQTDPDFDIKFEFMKKEEIYDNIVDIFQYTDWVKNTILYSKDYNKVKFGDIKVVANNTRGFYIQFASAIRLDTNDILRIYTTPVGSDFAGILELNSDNPLHRYSHNDDTKKDSKINNSDTLIDDIYNSLGE